MRPDPVLSMLRPLACLERKPVDEEAQPTQQHQPSPPLEMSAVAADSSTSVPAKAPSNTARPSIRRSTRIRSTPNPGRNPSPSPSPDIQAPTLRRSTRLRKPSETALRNAADKAPSAKKTEKANPACSKPRQEVSNIWAQGAGPSDDVESVAAANILLCMPRAQDTSMTEECAACIDQVERCAAANILFTMPHGPDAPLTDFCAGCIAEDESTAAASTLSSMSPARDTSMMDVWAE